jgi:hypothetical protein
LKPSLRIKGGSRILPENFRYVDTRTLRASFQVGKFGEAALRQKLPSPLYWIQPDRKILWNFELVRDYLLNGDGPAHQRLVEEYLATLPSNRSA